MLLSFPSSCHHSHLIAVKDELVQENYIALTEKTYEALDIVHGVFVAVENMPEPFYYMISTEVVAREGCVHLNPTDFDMLGFKGETVSVKVYADEADKEDEMLLCFDEN